MSRLPRYLQIESFFCLFALAVVAHGGPALNLDGWSYDALPWRAWSNDQADVESFYVTGANRGLFVGGELDAAVGASYGVVGLERTLDGVDLSPYAGTAHANHSSHFATRLESA